MDNFELFGLSARSGESEFADGSLQLAACAPILLVLVVLFVLVVRIIDSCGDLPPSDPFHEPVTGVVVESCNARSQYTFDLDEEEAAQAAANEVRLVQAITKQWKLFSRLTVQWAHTANEAIRCVEEGMLWFTGYQYAYSFQLAVHDTLHSRELRHLDAFSRSDDVVQSEGLEEEDEGEEEENTLWPLSDLYPHCRLTRGCVRAHSTSTCRARSTSACRNGSLERKERWYVFKKSSGSHRTRVSVASSLPGHPICFAFYSEPPLLEDVAGQAIPVAVVNEDTEEYDAHLDMVRKRV